jgi:transcription elongation factor Elf1
MNKQSIIVALASLFLTAAFATLFGFAGRSIVGTFWSWFWISTLSMFVVFGIINSYFISKDINLLQKNEIEILEQLSKFTITVNCAYCQQQNNVPIQLNARNTFKCESCNQVNGISMQFMATSITTPLNIAKSSDDKIVFQSIR